MGDYLLAIGPDLMGLCLSLTQELLHFRFHVIGHGTVRQGAAIQVSDRSALYKVIPGLKCFKCRRVAA